MTKIIKYFEKVNIFSNKISEIQKDHEIFSKEIIVNKGNERFRKDDKNAQMYGNLTDKIAEIQIEHKIFVKEGLSTRKKRFRKDDKNTQIF